MNWTKIALEILTYGIIVAAAGVLIWDIIYTITCGEFQIHENYNDEEDDYNAY